MEIGQASKQFNRLLSKIRICELEQFLLWTKKTVIEKLEKIQSEDNSAVILNSIRDDIRENLPIEAVTKTETIICPKSGPNADCDPKSTLHVDAFLYNEDTIDELCEEGKMSRNYCTQCLSRDVKPLTFISHSASMEQVKFIYQYLLTDLRGKVVLDVGSRTGALLYGGHLYSEARRIVGVELDPTFCELQTKMVTKYNFTDRIRIIHDDIMNQTELLQKSDVIILNNVFEFFMSAEQQIKIWQYLYKNIRKKKSILITIPSIEESLENIEASLDLTTWIKPMDITNSRDVASLRYFSSTEDSDLDNIFMYQVM